MNPKRSTTSNYYHRVFQDGGYWECRVYSKSPSALLDGAIVNSARDANRCAAADIRRLENGTHYTQQRIAA